MRRTKNVLEINSNKIKYKTTRALLGNETILHVLERMDALPLHLVERGSPPKKCFRVYGVLPGR